MNIFNYSSFYQGRFFSSLLFIPLAFGFNPNNISAHEILMPEGNEIEIFDAWCDEPKKDCSVNSCKK